MEDLRIIQSDKTPLIEFKTNGDLKIEGRSVPENIIEFYQAPLNWISNFSKDRPARVNLSVKLDHLNTSSSKVFFDIFKALEQMKLHRTNVNVFWYYSPDNENMLETGEDYKSIFKIPFQLVKT